MALCWSKNTRTATRSPTRPPPEKASWARGHSPRSGSWRCPQLYNRLSGARRRRPSLAPRARTAPTARHPSRNSSARACLLLATATLNRGAASCSRGRTFGSEANNRSAAWSCLAFAAAPKACNTSGPTRSGLAGDTSAPVDTTGAAAFSGIVVVDSAIWPAPKAMAASTTSPLPAAAARVRTVSPSLVDEEMGKHPLSDQPQRLVVAVAHRAAHRVQAPRGRRRAVAHASRAVRPASSVASLSAPAPNNNEATAPSFALAALCRGLCPLASSAANKAFLAASSPACRATNVAAASYAPNAQATCSGVLLPPSLANAPALSRPGSVAHSRRQARTKVARASTASAARRNGGHLTPGTRSAGLSSELARRAACRLTTHPGLSARAVLERRQRD